MPAQVRGLDRPDGVAKSWPGVAILVCLQLCAGVKGVPAPGLRVDVHDVGQLDNREGA